MLTFFGPWGEFTLEEAGVVGRDQHPDLLLSALHCIPRVQEIKQALAEFKFLADAKSFLTGHSASVELCMDTLQGTRNVASTCACVASVKATRTDFDR